MKKATDPRHKARRIALMALFEWSFLSKDPQEKAKKLLQEFEKTADHDLALSLIAGVVRNIETIDKIIETSAPEWPLDQVSKIDLAIIRIAIYEILIKKEVPPKVAIDEAVELGKEYGSETSGSFVNGVLGTVMELNNN